MESQQNKQDPQCPLRRQRPHRMDGKIFKISNLNFQTLHVQISTLENLGCVPVFLFHTVQPNPMTRHSNVGERLLWASHIIGRWYGSIAEKITFHPGQRTHDARVDTHSALHHARITLHISDVQVGFD